MQFRKPPHRDRFEALMREHERLVGKVARAYARTPEDQQDLGQEIWVQAWRSFGRFDEARPFGTWLFRVALNVGIAFARRNPPAVDDEEALEKVRASEPDPEVRMLYRVVDGLEPLPRALLLLVLEGYSHEEIGEMLGMSAGAVATRLSRLKSELRTEYGEEK